MSTGNEECAVFYLVLRNIQKVWRLREFRPQKGVSQGAVQQPSILTPGEVGPTGEEAFKQRLAALGRHLEKGPQPWETFRLSALFGFWSDSAG